MSKRKPTQAGVWRYDVGPVIAASFADPDKQLPAAASALIIDGCAFGPDGGVCHVQVQSDGSERTAA